MGWLVLAAAIGILASQILGNKGPKVGGEAPDLDLPLLGGGVERLSDLRGKVVVLDFWATWCPPCVDSLPVLHRVSSELAEMGLVTYAINRDDGRDRKERVQAFLSHHGLEELQVALDDGGAAGAFGVRALPTMVVIDREGKVASAQVGAMNEKALRAYLGGFVEP